MATLSEQLLNEAHYDQLIAECVSLIDSQVAAKKGLSGAGVKTAFKILKSVKKGILEKACRYLMPDFTNALEPFYQDFSDSDSTDFNAFLQSNPEPVVAALLGVTDAKVESLENSNIQSVYRKLRGSAEAEVATALPELGRITAKFIRD